MNLLKALLGILLLLGAAVGAVLTKGMLLPMMLPLAAFGIALLAGKEVKAK